MELTKRVAVITGAANGIGLALAHACIKQGFQVVMADISTTSLCDRVEQLSDETDANVLGIVCDVTRPDNLNHLAKETIERFGRVDWLFNNAGIGGHLVPVWELTPEHIRKVMDVNLYGVIHGIQAFLPYMFKQNHESHIINMASFYGLCSGSQMSAYTMSKHAIVALSESLYFDLLNLDKHVNVSVVCPSFANTQLLSNSIPIHNNTMHHMVKNLIEKSRPAEEVADHIIQAVKKNQFYILPDPEIKKYCEQRTEAIITQTAPHQHGLEKIITRLSKRRLAEETSI